MTQFDIDPDTTRPIDMMHQFSASHEWFERWQHIANDCTNTLSDQARAQIQKGMLLYVQMLEHKIKT
jgi:hypothetical protein